MDLNQVNDSLLNETLSKFESIPINENGWSNRNLHSLRIYLKECKTRSFQHSVHASRCGTIHNIISIPGIISGGAATALAFFVVGSPESSTFNMNIAIATLSSISSIVKGIETTLRYSDQEYQHKRAIDVYGELCRRIESYIIHPDVPAKNAMLEIKKDYDSAISHSPFILIPETEIKV